jgi:hypothetical protein
MKIIGEDKKQVSDFSSLVERTNKANPKEKDMRELKQYFDNDPSIALQVGNVNKTIFDSILETMAGESEFGRETIRRYIKNMKSELGYHNSTFVEKMLIDEVVMHWLRLQSMDHDHKIVTYGQHRFAEGLYHDKRLHLAQARYLKAIETLAKVRKMIAATQAKGAKMFKNLMSKEPKT